MIYDNIKRRNATAYLILIHCHGWVARTENTVARSRGLLPTAAEMRAKK